MSEPRVRSIQCTGTLTPHKLVWYEWGDPNNSRVVICAHALDRVAHDFSALAESLSDRYRVVCFDFPGRGHSDWLEDARDYNHNIYLSDVSELIESLDVDSIDWVGTSLGGIIGLKYAAQNQNKIRKLILNDIGTEVSASILKKAGTAMGQSLYFRDLDHAVLMFKVMTAECGPLSNAQWLKLTEPMIRLQPDGRYMAHYDTAIAQNFLASDEEDDLNLWPYYNLFDGSVMLIRGEISKIFTLKNFLSMQKGRMNTFSIEIKGTGHAPMLVKENEILAIKNFLDQ